MKKQVVGGMMLVLLHLAIGPIGHLLGQVQLDNVPRMAQSDRFRAIELLMRELEADFQSREERRRHSQLLRQLRIKRKAAELASVAQELEKRLSDPHTIHGDTPKLIKRCENLSKSLAKLLGLRKRGGLATEAQSAQRTTRKDL